MPVSLSLASIASTSSDNMICDKKLLEVLSKTVCWGPSVLISPEVPQPCLTHIWLCRSDGSICPQVRLPGESENSLCLAQDLASPQLPLQSCEFYTDKL